VLHISLLGRFYAVAYTAGWSLCLAAGPKPDDGAEAVTRSRRRTMLNDDGAFSFTQELMALADAFLREYEEAKGAIGNDLDRGLVMTYVLGSMLCDLELIWEELGRSPVFGPLDPLALYQECVQENEGRAEVRCRVEKELMRRGWVPQQEAKEDASTGVDGESEGV